jgi:hypothetical protein
VIVCNVYEGQTEKNAIVDILKGHALCVSLRLTFSDKEIRPLVGVDCNPTVVHHLRLLKRMW